MILINRNETDPHFNIAAEEYALKHFDEDIFMLWINQPSVIIGKHQVATAEVNIIYTNQLNIPIIRRISGGGTVYHDEGNLNYSLIVNGETGKLVDYEKYAGTVIRALASQGVEVSLQGKSSLATKGMKFSGNAEHVYKTRVLHHGTLLFDSNLDQLRKCIRPEHEHYNDKSVKSVDSKITNLSRHLREGMGMSEFRNILIKQIEMDFPGITHYDFNKEDYLKINELIKEKYARSEWNFAYSPKYTIEKELVLNEKAYNLKMSIEKGRITQMKISLREEKAMQDICESLIYTLHHPKDIYDALKRSNFAHQFNKPGLDTFIYGLF